MGPYQEITTALAGRERWQLVTFAAGCAERLAPVVRLLDGPGRREVLEPGLRLAWAAADGQQVQPEAAAKILATFQPILDAAPDTAEVPETTAIRALGLVADALAGVVGDDPLHAVRRACAEGLGLSGEFDAWLTEPPGVRLGPLVADLPPPGTLETAEIAVQRESMLLMDAPGRTRREVVAEVRRRCGPLAAGMEAIFPEAACRVGWQVASPSQANPR